MTARHLQVSGLTVGFHETEVATPAPIFQDFSFTISGNHFVAIVGRSGCGKTTLLRTLIGLQHADRGNIAWNGRTIKSLAVLAGMVFQSPHLLPWRNTRQNVAFGLEARGLSDAVIETRVTRMLALTGLQDAAHKRPFQLSGGMQQRANLARALVLEPEILLMDEPFSALDSLLREQLQSELQRLWIKNPCQVIFVTHQLDEAAWLADEVWVMSDHPARIVQRLVIDLPRPRARDRDTMARVADYQHQLRTWLGGGHNDAAH